MQTITHPDNHSRSWTVAELPQADPQDLKEIEIVVRYTGQSNLLNGTALDDYVIPLFKLAPRLLEAIRLKLIEDHAALRLTAEEISEVRRLSKVYDTNHP